MNRRREIVVRGQQAGSAVFTSRQSKGPVSCSPLGTAPGGFSSPEAHTVCAAPGAEPSVSDRPMLMLGKQWDRTVSTRRMEVSVGGKEMSLHINSICSAWNIRRERCEKQETVPRSLQITQANGRWPGHGPREHMATEKESKMQVSLGEQQQLGGGEKG